MNGIQIKRALAQLRVRHGQIVKRQSDIVVLRGRLNAEARAIEATREALVLLRISKE